MDELIAVVVKVGHWLADQGALGVLCLCLMAAIMWLIRLLAKKQEETEKYQTANVGLYDRLNELQERRVAEKVETVRALETTRSSMESNTHATAGLQASIAALHAVVVDRSRR